ncbi:MAG: TSUP family transporter [Rhodobacteraceae bacterium]|nr:TSUP family transporter [Paracoccaceae bacterium]
MQLDLMFFAFAVPSVVFAGVSKGGFGSGAAFASASILAIILTPGQALALMLPLLMLIDVAALRPYWRRWNLRASSLIIMGGMPGVVLGALIYRMVNDDVMRVMIGAISVGFVVWQLVGVKLMQRRRRLQFGDGVGLVSGFAAGFASFVSHAGGPPAAVYLLSQRLSKTEYQASTVLIFWILNAVKFGFYAVLGLFTVETLWANVLLAPFALFGTWLGVRMHFRIPEWAFFAVTYVLLTVTGIKLIWDGLV